MIKTPYLILIVCVLFTTEGFCQNLSLKIEGQNKIESSIIDSLGYLKLHTDFKSIQSEVDLINAALFKIGYIENEIKSMKKTNDTTFYTQIH